ncbi:MAG: efflux RND transporter periplasmic adaptor subunit [Caldimonas sp.]|uniref:efflux RND transporter periplasmic adaptor subunit n=1 Tax=Caldimonas sp. TaxID=2838790 RepID=UPI00391AC304
MQGADTLVRAMALGLVLAAGEGVAQGVVVPTVAVRAAAVGQGLELDGRLEAVRQSVVAAQVPGNVVQLAVRAGDVVKAGQVLARIDPREAQASVARGDAGVAQARAALSQARADVERQRELKKQGFISQAALDAAEARFLAAEAGLAEAAAGRGQAALARSFTTVVAPYDGLVLATHVEAGDLATPGRPVVTVYAPQPMRAVVYVPASRRAALGEGARAQVRLPSGRWVQPAKVTVLPGADPVSQTLEVRLDLAAADVGQAVPGQAVRVRLSLPGESGPGSEAAGQRLTVPASALLRRGELTAVYVAREGRFVLQAVRTGADHGQAGVEVLAGLSEGQAVATDPVRAGLAGAVPQQP